jgi:hypothetical protein
MPLGADYIATALDDIVAGWPATGATYNLFVSDPSLETTATDVELDSTGGYAGVTFAPSDWADASGNSKATTSAVSFGTSTDAYSDVATYWGILDTDGALVFSDDLDDPIEVDAASTAVSFTPTLTFSDGD